MKSTFLTVASKAFHGLAQSPVDLCLHFSLSLSPLHSPVAWWSSCASFPGPWLLLLSSAQMSPPKIFDGTLPPDSFRYPLKCPFSRKAFLTFLSRITSILLILYPLKLFYSSACFIFIGLLYIPITKINTP